MLNLNSSFLTFSLKELVSQNQTKVSGVIQNLKNRVPDLNDWVGWLNLHEDKKAFDEIQAFADETINSGKFKNVVVLGIGGSSLGPIALFQALKLSLWNETPSDKRGKGLNLYFIDNLDPDWNNGIYQTLDYTQTLFLVITKSGGTIETIAPFLVFMDQLKAFYEQKNMKEEWKKHFVFITDPDKSKLRTIANREGIKCFDIAPNVGGRFSVFSAVGLLPMALVGVEINKFQVGLKKAFDDMVSNQNIENNLACNLALALFEADTTYNKNIIALMPYSTHLSKISDWFVQLVAESLGKTRQVGPTPIKAVGATDQHSQLQLFSDGPLDKIIVFLKVIQFKKSFEIKNSYIPEFADLNGQNMQTILNAEQAGTAKAIFEGGVPSLTIEIPSITEESIAYLLFSFELMTAIMGGLYGINPFDQPGVELSKKYTQNFLKEQK